MGEFIEGQVWSDPSTWRAIEDLSEEDQERHLYWGGTAAEWEAEAPALERDLDKMRADDDYWPAVEGDADGAC
jgi:hypothetical protein